MNCDLCHFQFALTHSVLCADCKKIVEQVIDYDVWLRHKEGDRLRNEMQARVLLNYLSVLKTKKNQFYGQTFSMAAGRSGGVKFYANSSYTRRYRSW